MFKGGKGEVDQVFGKCAQYTHSPLCNSCARLNSTRYDVIRPYNFLFFLTDAVPCSNATLLLCGGKASCLADPLLPQIPICRCHKGFRLSKNKTCEGRILNK